MESKLSEYYALLARWNRKIRLVAACESEERFEREHVADIRQLLPFLAGARTLLDLGTGAGIPGLLIKILMPELHVTLLDATRKKIGFCEEAIRTLRLGGVRAVCGRAEDPETISMVGRFDAIVTRATWEIKEYIRISTSYIDSGGRPLVIAFKGVSWKKELEAASDALEEYGMRLVETHHYKSGDRPRSILIFGRR